MKKILVLIAACAIALTACGSSDADTATPDDSVSTWADWGKYAVQALDSCETDDYPCNHQVITDLQAKAEPLPAPVSGTTQYGVESFMLRFQQDYATWVSEGCETVSSLKCAGLIHPARLESTTQLKEYAQELAES